MNSFPTIAIRSYDDLITAIRAVKEFLGLSNEAIEDLAGLTRGHWDKVAGRTPVKRMGPMVLNAVLGVLAIELHVKPDVAAVEKLSHRWQRRHENHVRTCQPISQATLDRCRPIILSEMARKGWQTRNRQARRTGHANGTSAGR